MRPMILNDNSYLYSENCVIDYLTSLGFDIEQLQTFFKEYSKDGRDCDSLAEIIDYQEQIMDDYFCRLRDMGSEIEELCNKLRDGKGGTKRQMADKIMSVIEYYGI